MDSKQQPINLSCQLQSYLARSCTALWPLSCSAIWHQSTVDSSWISSETMTETRHCGTSGPADHERLGALDRSPILLPDRNERVARAHLVQEPKPIARRIHRRAADSHRVEIGTSTRS
jgi:hypothetical protein